MKFDGILFCTDIDGTLTEYENKISKDNLDAIEYFIKNGGTFTLATGRTPFTIPEILNQYISVPVICQNGALFDVHKKEYLYYEALDDRAIEIAKEISEKFPTSGIECFRLFDIAFVKDNKATLRHIETENVTCATHLNCSLDEVEGPVLKVLFAQENEETDTIYEFYKNSAYQKEYQLVKSHSWYYEILRNDTNKGEALKKLCELTGFDLKKVIAAGDNDNDIELIKYAGCGWAVKNATMNLKRAADKVTKRSNAQSAVAEIIYNI